MSHYETKAKEHSEALEKLIVSLGATSDQSTEIVDLISDFVDCKIALAVEDLVDRINGSGQYDPDY